MITIIYGVPGSGKTYYAVHWIRKKCLEEGDAFYRVRSDVLLITNLKLRLDNEENYIFLEDVKEFARYMDVDFWRANLSRVQGKKVYIVMDECQLFFHYYKDDPKVLFYLQYHRHLSHDILLITQTPKSLPAKVFELSEFLIEAVPKSVNPFAFRGFRYRVVHPFDRSVVLRRFHLAYDNTVFYLYEDMIYRADEEKIQNAFTRWGVILGVLLVLFVITFKLFLDFPSRFSKITSGSSAFASSGGSGGGKKFPSGGSGGSGGSIKYSDLVKEVKEASSGGSSEVPSFCFDEAGRYYEISPLLLRAIAQVESGLNPKAYRANPDGSASIGLMQVNTKWLSDLRRAGYDESLFWDVCYNVWLGAWVLKSCIQRYGYDWRAVDCYRGVPNPSGSSSYVWAVYRTLRQSLEDGKRDDGKKLPFDGFKFAGMP
jgi:uncharacterized membrane protein YgcG